jgi:nitrile hydratase beta subunit
VTYVSHADLGGTTGHGPVVPEPEGELWHHDWEPKALAVNVAAGASGKWNIDMSRRYRETLPDYDELTYYEIWIAGLERLLVDRGLVTAEELSSGRRMTDPIEVRGVLRADRVADALAAGRPAEREPAGPARFSVGDRVRTRAGSVDHHTRLPGYAAGQVGTVERVHGAHVFPDTHAHELGEQPQWLYTVVIDATDIWDDAAPGQTVAVDAWESYLSPAASDDADGPSS